MLNNILGKNSFEELMNASLDTLDNDLPPKT